MKPSNTDLRRPRGWPLRYYEAVVRLGGTLPDGEAAAGLGSAPAVYDIDPVVAYLSGVEEWTNTSELPAVEPPPSAAGRVLADFVLPDTTAEQSERLRREGGMAAAEEWVEDIGDRPQGDVVGCVFSPAEKDGRLARLTRGHREVSRAWSAVITLAGWEPAAEGGGVLREKQTYDWLVGVTEAGRFAGRADLDVSGRELGEGRGPERDLWEHYGMSLLYPFLFSFALLACANVRAGVVSKGEFDPDPVYLRPRLDDRRGGDERTFPSGRFEHGDAPGHPHDVLYWDTDP